MKENSRSLRNISRVAFPAIFAFAALFAVSCGDDSSNSSGSDGGEESRSVKTLEDLGKCLSSSEGDIYRVEEMDGDYRCENGKWVAVSSFGECTSETSGNFASDSSDAKDVKTYVCKSDSSGAYGWSEATAGEIATGKVCSSELYNELDSGFVCDTSSGEYAWRKATATEKTLCTSKTAGSIVTDSSDSKAVKTYVCKADISGSYGWNEMTDGEIATGKICNSRILNQVDSGYVCVAGNGAYFWREATAGEIATGKVCTSALSYELDSGYVCDMSSGEYAWREVTLVEEDLSQCTAENAGTVAKSSSDSKTYVCKLDSSGSYGWLEATEAERVVGKICSADIFGLLRSGYVCDTSSGEYAWRDINTAEKMTGKVCTQDLYNEMLSGYVCKVDTLGRYKWRQATAGEKAVGKRCTEEALNELTDGYVCSRAVVAFDADTLSEEKLQTLAGACYLGRYLAVDSVALNVFLEDGLKFDISECYYWREATARETYLDKICEKGVNDSEYVYQDSLFLCTNGKWKNMSATVYDKRDQKTYRTVTIGTQRWMAENLNYAYPKTSENVADSLSFCYDNDTANCAKYGRLYTWSAAMDTLSTGCGYGVTCSVSKPVQGVCPQGWHLPDTTEWNTLSTFVAKKLYNGKTDSVGYALKATSGWEDNGNGSDAFGFGALPAGYVSIFFNEFREPYSGNFWSSTEENTDDVYGRSLDVNSTLLKSVIKSLKVLARSVRCVKD